MLFCGEDAHPENWNLGFGCQVSGVRREKDWKYALRTSIIAFFRPQGHFHTHIPELSLRSFLNLKPDTCKTCTCERLLSPQTEVSFPNNKPRSLSEAGFVVTISHLDPLASMRENSCEDLTFLMMVLFFY